MKAFGNSLVVWFSILLLVFPLPAAAPAQSRPANQGPKTAKTPAAQKPKPPAADAHKDQDLYYVDIVSLNPVKGGVSTKDVIPLLGKTDPYALKAPDETTIIIYRTAKDAFADQKKTVDEYKSTLQTLVEGHSEVIRVAHSGYLGDLMTALKKINGSKNITVTAVGTDSIRITRAPGVLPSDYDAFLSDLHRLEWQMKTDTPVQRVFYVNAPEVSAALGGKGGSKGVGTDASVDNSGGTPSKTDSNTTKAKKKANEPDASAASKPAPKSAPGKSAKPSADGAPSKPAKPAPKGASSKPDAADAGSGDDSKADAGSGKDENSDQSSTPSPVTAKADDTDSKGGGDSSSSSISVASVNDDLLVFSAQPGHEADISEKKRLLANIDFPRPEVLLNIWSFQASSSRMNEVSQRASELRRSINLFNDAIQNGIDRAWKYLQNNLKGPADFDPNLYGYLTKQYVGTSRTPAANLSAEERNNLGICEEDKYCLGYSSLFHPLKPTLTDMLLEIVVAKDPTTHIKGAVKEMEGGDRNSTGFYDESPNSMTCESVDRTDISSNLKNLEKLEKFQNEVNASEKDQKRTAKDAEEFEKLRKSLKNGTPIHCLLAEALLEFGSTPDQASRVRLLRAALADFLFHYKISQQYPHEFSPYDLTQSAQELNSELNPLILAFNRDISAVLDVLSHEADRTMTSNGWWGTQGHGSTFINNGVITVRTLSGKSTTVDTVTQSVFDATDPPSITDLIKSIGDAESNVPKLLKTNLTANEAAAVIGALNSVTPAQSKIGREFKINITPRSLSGASSSELQVNLDAKESAEPTLFSNGKDSPDNISRVADHNVNTKVRLESIKLFEISSFSAFLERSRKNFPIVPPVFELPYIGSILSLPLPGAKEYHRSTAVISAIVVPTAIDIVSGIRFNFDRVMVPPDSDESKGTDKSREAGCCIANVADSSVAGTKTISAQQVALSIGDLSRYPISAFHRAMIACFATGTPYVSSTSASAPGTPADTSADKDKSDCGSIKLSDLYPVR